jgi:hypothetical protein
MVFLLINPLVITSHKISPQLFFLTVLRFPRASRGELELLLVGSLQEEQMLGQKSVDRRRHRRPDIFHFDTVYKV